MSVSDDAVSADLVEGPLGPLRPRQLLLITGTVIACAGLFAVTVLHGYLANGLLQVPVDQISNGAYDPRDLPDPPSTLSQVLGYLAIATAPLAGFSALMVSGADVLQSVHDHRSPREMVPSAAVVLLAVAMLAGCAALSPIASWWLD
ncbi:hypothetical protein SAMN06264364_1215 [Quadrisphaera granulorum]|uniref:Uncharacterized protein n=1 Tax=Quadrisphaera granulorum TaxID=317664 RepID=A0A316A1M1_9ACTN|nr:hypothetical protein [Quadrisphaera granulorum]PWJ51128.1 hypothetical protein BXY45_1215 [Quadrisphaera granulorum]SZE97778.1 hypothetical protein SAMN06264364_1215 [Quadrisphaera granulorum]